MANQLTDSEAKMLRVRALKHGLIWPDHPEFEITNAYAALSELLLAAKERSKSDEDWGDLFDEKV